MTYIDAHNMVSKLLRRGEIIAYSCEYESGLGRTIYVETDQGWNPEPFYSDLECMGG